MKTYSNINAKPKGNESEYKYLEPYQIHSLKNIFAGINPNMLIEVMELLLTVYSENHKDKRIQKLNMVLQDMENN